MKKIVLAPDSFKGSLSSLQAIEIMKKEILSILPNCEVIGVPIADGGEGTVDSFLTLFKGEKVYVDTLDPLLRPIKSYYGLFSDFAVIEVANVSGITLLDESELNPYLSSTFGLGALFKDAISKGCKQIYFGLGGSATIDLGIGLAQSLGAIFYDGQNNAFIPTPKTIQHIYDINLDAVNELFRDVSVTGISDVDNLLYGKLGSVYVYGPQKGATKEMLSTLDYSFKHFSDVIYQKYQINLQTFRSSGAAGGLGAAIKYLFNGDLKSGIETLLLLSNFDSLIKDADMIITGEGKIDHQSSQGKVIFGIASHAKMQNIKVIALCGATEGDLSSLHDIGVTKIYNINPEIKPFNELKKLAKENLTITIHKIIKKEGNTYENIR